MITISSQAHHAVFKKSDLLKNVKAVLFDFDGSLADSFKFHLAAWRHVLDARNIAFNPFIVTCNEGRPVEEIAGMLLRDAGVSLSPEDANALVQSKNRHFQQNNRTGPLPGIPELLKKLKASGRKIGLVTGTLRKNLDTAVDAEFLADFDVIVTVEDTKKGKPHPAPFLAGAAKLGLQPGECLAVENAPMGIASAKAAGMRCAALATTLEEKYLSEADAIFAGAEEFGAHA